jgi:hypothetical protein
MIFFSIFIVLLHCNWFLEFATLLDLEHEIASVDVLHDKVETVLTIFKIIKNSGLKMLSFYHSLEAGMQLHQERRLLGKRQHSLFHHGALNIVILDDDILLQDLDGVQLVCTLSLSQHDL